MAPSTVTKTPAKKPAKTPAKTAAKTSTSQSKKRARSPDASITRQSATTNKTDVSLQPAKRARASTL
ncbi:hypothetical protein HYPSUDRAFT_44623, partial [Hypholoma sublateritium FD-334 SS-4]